MNIIIQYHFIQTRTAPLGDLDHTSNCIRAVRQLVKPPDNHNYGAFVSHLKTPANMQTL